MILFMYWYLLIYTVIVIIWNTPIAIFLIYVIYFIVIIYKAWTTWYIPVYITNPKYYYGNYFKISAKNQVIHLQSFISQYKKTLRCYV